MADVVKLTKMLRNLTPQFSAVALVGMSIALIVTGYYFPSIARNITIWSHSPSITVTPGAVHLGRLAQDAVTSFTIRLRNTSDAPITIQSIGTSCGCTTATATSSVVPPHGDTVINGRLLAEMLPGHYVRTVFVRLGSSQDQLFIPIDVDVYSLISVDNPYVDFGTVPFGTRRSIDVLVRGTHQSGPIHPHILSCPNWISIVWRKIGTNLWRCTLSIKSLNTSGEFHGEVKFDSGHSPYSFFVIMAEAKVPSIFHCSPEVMNFGTVVSEKSTSIMITGKNNSSEMLKISSVPRYVKASLVYTKQGTLLTATISSDHKGSIVSDVLVLEAKQHRSPQKSLDIPLTAILE